MADVSFAEFLRQLRMRRGVTELSQALSSVRHFCNALTDQHYPIDADTYIGIESGAVFPPDADRFIDAIATCLGLCASEVDTLLQKLAYEALRLDAGEKLARTIFPDALSLH